MGNMTMHNSLKIQGEERDPPFSVITKEGSILFDTNAAHEQWRDPSISWCQSFRATKRKFSVSISCIMQDTEGL